MKANGWWNLCDIIYPIVGGTQTAHKWNLKDPQDLNASFRLAFTGGWTHNANGMDGNGSGWADTFFYPSINGVQNQHIAENCIENVDANSQEIGIDGSGTEISQWMSVFGGSVYWRNYGLYTSIGNAPPNSIAFMLSQRQNNTQGYMWRSDGVSQFIPSTGFAGFPPTYSMVIGAKRSTGGGVLGLSNRMFNYISVGTAIPQADVPNYGALVLQLQIDLGR